MDEGEEKMRTKNKKKVEERGLEDKKEEEMLSLNIDTRKGLEKKLIFILFSN